MKSGIEVEGKTGWRKERRVDCLLGVRTVTLLTSTGTSKLNVLEHAVG